MKVTSCHSSDARHQEKAALCKYKNKQQTLPPIYHLSPAPKKTTTAPEVSQPPARGSDFSYRQETGGLIKSGVKNIKGERSLFRSPRVGPEGGAQRGCGCTWLHGTEFRWCRGGGSGCFGPRVGCRASLSSHCRVTPCPLLLVQLGTAVAAQFWPGQGVHWGSPRRPRSPRVEKGARGASRSDLQECPQPSARSYEVPVSQDRGWHFHCAHPGMCCNGAAASILCPPPRRGGVSASARVTRHTLLPPSPPPQPPNLAPLATAAFPCGSRPRALPAPPALSSSIVASSLPWHWVPSTGGVPRQVWGHSTKAMPHLEPPPVLTPGFPQPRLPPLPAAGLLPNFHNQLTNEGPTPPKTNCGSPGAGGSPGSPGTMPPFPAPFSCPQRAAARF